MSPEVNRRIAALGMQLEVTVGASEDDVEVQQVERSDTERFARQVHMVVIREVKLNAATAVPIDPRPNRVPTCVDLQSDLPSAGKRGDLLAVEDDLEAPPTLHPAILRSANDDSSHRKPDY
jgi:hypothetical protein